MTSFVYSTSFEDHLEHLKNVLTKLGEAGLNLKPTKCDFAQQQEKYLGYLISEDRVAVDSSKVEAVTSYPQPADVKELWGFLGLANYYRRFVQGFASIAHPLYQQTIKNAKGFDWTHTASRLLISSNSCWLVHPSSPTRILRFPLWSSQMRQIMLLVEPSARFRMVRNELLHTSVGNWGRLSRTTLQLRGKH